MHYWAEINAPHFGIKRSKVRVTMKYAETALLWLVNTIH